MDLATSYLGLRLRSPLVASAGPLTSRIDTLLALEEAGIAAVVLPSLFEEQVIHDELSTTEMLLRGDGSNPEATGYFPDIEGQETIADRYLRHVEEAKRALEIPVIASLNGTSAGGWTRYARLLQEAGADALELNLYRVAADITTPAARVEEEELELVAQVDAAVSLPLAVKVGPYYTAFANMAVRLIEAGADGLVLFNRFYQPDVDPAQRRVVASLDLSTSRELRVPLRWIGILYGQVAGSLAASTGIHTGADVAKVLLAGADVAMMTSALLLHGPGHVRTVETALDAWGTEMEFTSVAQLRGSVSRRHVPDPDAFERANYIETLVHYADTFTSAQGFGPY